MKFNIISSDSEYFKDDEDIIQIGNCDDNTVICSKQLKYINLNLLLVRKFVEKKEYPAALNEIKKAFLTTSQINQEKCKKCGDIIRSVILNTLNNTITDLRKMTTGFFANKNYKFDLTMAEQLLRELESGN